MSNKLGAQIADAIGLPAERLQSYTIEFQPGGVTKVTAKYIVKPLAAIDGKALTTIKNYDLVERKAIE